MHAIQPANQRIPFIHLDRMTMPKGEEVAIQPADAAIDPGAAPS